MPKSTCLNYSVKIVNPDNQVPYHELKTPDGIFILVQQNDSFIVQIESDLEEIFSSKLMIDGYELPGKKTWKKRGKIIKNN